MLLLLLRGVCVLGTRLPVELGRLGAITGRWMHVAATGGGCGKAPRCAVPTASLGAGALRVLIAACPAGTGTACRLLLRGPLLSECVNACAHGAGVHGRVWEATA